jgi:hypothetical protein
MRKAALDFKVSLKNKFKKYGRSPSPASRPESAHGQAAVVATEADPHAKIDESVRRAGEALSTMRSLQETTRNIISAVDNAPSTVDDIISLANSWQPLLNNLKVFSSLVDKITEVGVFLLWTSINGW